MLLVMVGGGDGGSGNTHVHAIKGVQSCIIHGSVFLIVSQYTEKVALLLLLLLLLLAHLASHHGKCP